MASSTTNYGLTKPDATELYDIAVQNTNMDLIDSLSASKSEMYYHAGDSVNLYFTINAGILTGGQKEVRFSIPLPKPIDSSITDDNIEISGKWVIRHADGGNYLATNVTLQSLGTVSYRIVANGVQVRVQMTNAVSFANNSVVAVMGDTGATLTFS